MCQLILRRHVFTMLFFQINKLMHVDIKTCSELMFWKAHISAVQCSKTICNDVLI